MERVIHQSRYHCRKDRQPHTWQQTPRLYDTISKLGEAIGNVDPADEFLVLGDFQFASPSLVTCIPPRQPGNTGCPTSAHDRRRLPPPTTHSAGHYNPQMDGWQSAIDLTFASENIASRTISCRVDANLDHDSDHLQIATSIDWS